MSLSLKMPGDWTFFLDKKSVKIINFDRDKSQNEIWWIWFFVEFSNMNSILKQTKYAFLFLNSIDQNKI